MLCTEGELISKGSVTENESDYNTNTSITETSLKHNNCVILMTDRRAHTPGLRR